MTQPQPFPSELVKKVAALRAGAGRSASEDQERCANSLTLLQATLDSAADGLLVVDLNGKVVLHNSRFRSMWGVSPELAATEDDSRLLAHVAAQFDDPAAFVKRVQELYAQPEEESFDEIVSRDGRIFERYSKAQCVDGRCVGRVWSFRDVTERRRTEQRLREGEARYRHLLRHIPLSIWEVDYTEAWRWVEELRRSGVTDLREYVTARPEAAREFLALLRFVDVSDFSLAMFDAGSKEELIARLPELFKEETYRRIWGSLVAISEGRTQFTAEVPIVTLKGRNVDVSAHWAMPVRDGRIDLAHLIVAVDDITERRQAERQLSESEARYRHLFSHTPISIWEEDFTAVWRWMEELRREGVSSLREYIDARPEAPRNAMKLVRVVDVSDASLAMFEAPNKDALIRGLPALFTEEGYRRLGDMLVSLWEGRTQSSGEITALTLKGRRLDLLVHWAIPSLNGQPDLTRMVVAIDDISERVRLQDQLLKSQKLESIGTLAGGIAHDFNNLLAVVVGQASMQLRNRSLSTRVREALKDILHAAERGSALTQQLLAYARGGWQRPMPIDLNVVVESVMKILRRALPPQVEISLHLADDLAQVMADPSQVEQVVMNLCLNAAQASTAPGCVEVTTAADRLDEERARPWKLAPGDYVRLQVRDFGRGMEAAVMERIFEPFFTTRPEGRGMGLAVTLGVIKSHKGHIEVTSAPGRGTTMTVWLPAAPVPKDVPPGPAQRSRAAQLPRGSETLLVIDDDAAVRRTLETMLASLGYCVTSRGEPEEALALLESNAEDFHLVLLDANLPRFSQEEMFDRVRALCPRASVLLTSGFALQEQCAPLIARGAAGFVQKPLSMAVLATCVRTALDGGQKG